MLQGASSLFCSPKCESEYIMVAGGSGLRRRLRDLERGVCQVCKLDCLQLLKKLRCAFSQPLFWECPCLLSLNGRSA